MRRLLLLGLVPLVFACGGDDTEAQDDLSEENITTHDGATDVVLNADGFPNFAHTCWEGVGFWSTTDRVTIIVYNDWLCPGSTREQPMQVLSGNPQDVLNAAG